MTEERQTDATDGTDQTTGDAVVASGAQTVEEVEAFWRNRQSGLSRSHNAETQALKDQIAALKAAPVPAPSGETPEAARIRELESALAASQQAQAIAELQARYPETAETLGESIVGLPVEKIAAIEARFANVIAPRQDPNAAPRRSPGVPGVGVQKPTNEMTKDELLADLKRLAPALQASESDF